MIINQSPNKPAAGNAGIAPQLTIRYHCPGVPEPERSAHSKRIQTIRHTALEHNSEGST